MASAPSRAPRSSRTSSARASLGGTSPRTCEALITAATDVLAEALDLERKRKGGLSESSLGGRFKVHGKVGGPCPTCGTKLERVSFESYEMAYCPTCQTGGKVLADRRLSRLLK